MKTTKIFIVAGILLAAIGIIGMLFDCECFIPNDNTVTLIKFDARCTEHHKIEPVYMDASYPFEEGDTILVNENGVLPANPNDEETLSNLHEVILIKQVGTKTFTRDQAESQQ